MHFVANNLNTYISSPKVNEVGKYIKYFLVCAFCYELAETGKSGMVNKCFSLLKELKLRNPFFEIADKVFKFSYSDATRIWPNLCASKDVFNTNEDALTGTILNFRNVKVVLGKENVTIRAEKLKSKQHMRVKYRNETILHSIVVYFQIKIEIY